MRATLARPVSAAVLLIALLVPHPASATEEASAEWGYEGSTGPEHWAELDPAFATCAEGRSQSPIDIPEGTPVHHEAPTVAYTAGPITVVDNGHAIQVNGEDGSSAVIGGRTYQLLQSHFHSPSEHTLGGVHAAMEMHLVHADEGGDIAVIGVLIVEGEHNAAIDTIRQALPDEPGQTASPDGDFDLTELLPDSLGGLGYSGSLTTPPCTEGVVWHVLAEPIEMSADQLATFRAVHDGTNRPVQPLYERDVTVSSIATPTPMSGDA